MDSNRTSNINKWVRGFIELTKPKFSTNSITSRTSKNWNSTETNRALILICCTNKMSLNQIIKVYSTNLTAFITMIICKIISSITPIITKATIDMRSSKVYQTRDLSETKAWWSRSSLPTSTSSFIQIEPIYRHLRNPYFLKTMHK